VNQPSDVVNDHCVDSAPALSADPSSVSLFRIVTDKQVARSFLKVRSNDVLPFFLSYFTHLFNIVILTNKFLSCWKQSRVVPLRKKPGCDCLTNL
jgi:hypothetical protein